MSYLDGVRKELRRFLAFEERRILERAEEAAGEVARSRKDFAEIAAAATEDRFRALHVQRLALMFLGPSPQGVYWQVYWLFHEFDARRDVLEALGLFISEDGSQVTYAPEGWTVADKSAIEWTDATWNPVTGCIEISAGCANCYARKRAERNQRMGVYNYRNGFELTLQPQMLERPLQWKRERLIFVNSMSDLFHANVPLSYIEQVFDVMRRAHWHTFQVLTKRTRRLARIGGPRGPLQWPANVWQGVSVENDQVVDRIDDLRQTAAQVKFLSLEPLLGPLPGLNLDGIHWVIVGGESQTGARPMDADWVRDLRDQCLRAGVPFFFKQWGGVRKKAAGRELDGRTWDEFPQLARERGGYVSV